jgi:hypothetical protein
MASSFDAGSELDPIKEPKGFEVSPSISAPRILGSSNDMPGRGNEENPKEHTDIDARSALELRKIELEVRAAEQKLAGKERPSSWEVTKTLITWFGVVGPVVLSVLGYFHQQNEILRQHEAEARAERTKAIAAASELMSKGDRSSGVLQLALYGEEAIPVILGEVRITAFHIDWPSQSFAALTALKRIGVDKLKASDREFLNRQANLAQARLEDYAAGRQIQVVERETDLPGQLRRHEATSLFQLVDAIHELLGDPWNRSSERQQLKAKLEMK